MKRQTVKANKGDYVRTTHGQFGECLDRKGSYYSYNIPKLRFEEYGVQIKTTSADFFDLIEIGDLLYVDIDNGYKGGIVVPKMAETERELRRYKSNLRLGVWTLVGIASHEQIDEIMCNVTHNPMYFYNKVEVE